MSTTDTTETWHDQRFEDRLLDALLAEFDAPAEVRASAGRTPSPRAVSAGRGSAGTWLAAAAVVVLLGGSAWVFTGGLDPDDARVTVGGAPTTAAPEATYLAFPETAADPDVSVFHTTPWTADYDDPTPVTVWLRPLEGGRERPLVGVTYDPSLWDAGSGSTTTTPGGIELHVSPPWSDPSGPATYGTWQDAEGRVLTVQQATSSYLSRQQLDLLSTDEILDLVDAVRLDGRRIVVDDPDFARSEPEPNGFDRDGVDGTVTATAASSFAVAGDGATSTTPRTLLLDRRPGAVDLDDVAGEPVTVRGLPGVLGRSSTPIDNASALVWVEGGATYTLSSGGQGANSPTLDELATAAASLETVTKAEFDRRLDASPDPRQRGGVRLYLPRTGVVDGLRSVSLGADGTPLVGVATGSDAGYGPGRSKYVDLMVAEDAATILVWQGPSETAPACAQRIDVSALTPARPMRVDFDTSCAG